jgi:hypothetical protein
MFMGGTCLSELIWRVSPFFALSPESSVLPKVASVACPEGPGGDIAYVLGEVPVTEGIDL